MILALLALVAGFCLLVKGSDYFVDGAAGIAARFGIPQIIIGLTIVAMGTSAPEAAVSITAAFQGSADITIGNILGSNVMNVLVILGLSAAIAPLAVQKNTVRYEIPYLIFVSVVLLLLGMDGTITLTDGIILCVCFLIYMSYLAFSAVKMKESAQEQEEQKSVLFQIVALIGGMAAIVLGSKLAVSGATSIAQAIGVSDRFIGLTVVALGTSLPELFTSVTAARKGESDIAIGNIVGSNMFNILFVVGLTALITPVPYASKFIVDSLVVIGCEAALLLFVLRTKTLRRYAGIAMLAGYLCYFAYLCIG